jgi:hypothetical protein
LERFHLITEEGAEAETQVTLDGPTGTQAMTVHVTKTGPEFWNVELRAPGIQFESGKEYVLTFQAKCSMEQYAYFVPEKDQGDQASMAEGTTLAIGEQWTPCTVIFKPSASANPGRLTITDLGATPATYSFAGFHLTTR